MTGTLLRFGHWREIRCALCDEFAPPPPLSAVRVRYRRFCDGDFNRNGCFPIFTPPLFEDLSLLTLGFPPKAGPDGRLLFAWELSSPCYSDPINTGPLAFRWDHGPLIVWRASGCDVLGPPHSGQTRFLLRPDFFFLHRISFSLANCNFASALLPFSLYKLSSTCHTLMSFLFLLPCGSFQPFVSLI